jgi:hypothetical protein
MDRDRPVPGGGEMSVLEENKELVHAFWRAYADGD